MTIVLGFKFLDNSPPFGEYFLFLVTSLCFDVLNPSDTVRMSPGLDIHSLLGLDGTSEIKLFLI